MADFDILVLGELLIDFTPVGVSEHGNPLFERNPGGGPANMACAAARLGARAAFIGKVGNDNFGRALRDVLAQNGVDTENLRLSDVHPTTLAFVHLDVQGDRSFSFYRHGGADTMLDSSEVDYNLLDRCKYFFCSSVLMAEGPSRETSFQMMRAARERGVPVVFDPNLRANLWKSPEDMREIVRQALPLADILKISEEEAAFLTGEDSLASAILALRQNYAYRALLVTLGAKGCRAFAGNREISLEAFPVRAIDTTAAGDSFTGGFLAALLKIGKDVTALDKTEFEQAVRTANIVGGLTTSRKGAICALPSSAEVQEALEAMGAM